MPCPTRFTSFHVQFIALAARAQDTDSPRPDFGRRLAALCAAVGSTAWSRDPINQETNMTANFDPARVELDRALFLRLVNAAGTTVVCIKGNLWITRDGSPKDVELAPGQTYLVEDATRVIVCGLGPSLARVSQQAVHPQPAARRSLASFLRSHRAGVSVSRRHEVAARLSPEMADMSAV